MKQKFYFLCTLFWCTILSFGQTNATHLNFDGSNDYVSCGTTNLPTGTSARTIEAWIKTTQTTGVQSIINYGNQAIGNSRFGFLNASGNLYFVGENNDYYTNTLIADGNWHHVAATYEASTLKIYIDGALNATVTKVLNTNNNFFNIGASCNPTPGDFFNGSIDEVRVWNTARTAEQINGSKNCELQGNETGLVAYYNFNQGIDAANNSTITSLTDGTTNGNNGTLTNFALNGATSNWLAGSPVTTGSIVPAVATVTTPVVRNQGDTAPTLTATIGANGTGLLWYTTATGGTGSATAPTLSTATVGSTSYWVSSTNANGCESARVEIVFTVNALVSATHLNFDGTNDHVTIPATAINDLSQGTIEAWVYLNSLNQQTICAKQSDFENSYAILAVGGGQSDQGAPLPGEVNYQSINGSIIKSTTFLQTGQWYHLAITFTNTQAKLYINGTLNNTVNADFSIPNDVTVTATTIGAWLGSGGGQYFNGNIDEFRVWNVALSATDIANTMNCEAMSQPELVTYYKFNQGYDGVSNTSTTTLLDSAGSNNGTLTNFALTGATSNWKAGSTVATGNTCTVLQNESFNVSTNFKIYPNPTKNIVNIDVLNLDNALVEVYDINGRQLFTQKLNNTTNNVNIENLAAGVYMFKVTSNQGTATSKVIKQ